jgi:hypothetical protein
MHLEISQEPLDAELYRKNAAAQLEHPDQAPALTPTVRTPHFGHTVWGKLGKHCSTTVIRFHTSIHLQSMAMSPTALESPNWKTVSK